MCCMKLRPLSLTLAAACVSSSALADSITHGGTTIDMDFVDIGFAGNAADTSGYGSVGYEFRIGQYEVTSDQWTSVLAADPDVGDAGVFAGSQPTGAASWLEAARFCNWLTTGDAHLGPYQFTSITSPPTLIGVDRAGAMATFGTIYVLPTEDEWYKAAYFKADGSGYTQYPTGDSAPTAGIGGENYDDQIGIPWVVGGGTTPSIENNGTYDMGGNINEWIESAADGVLDDINENRVARGGAFEDPGFFLTSAYRDNWNISYAPDTFGFRVASLTIPEPSSAALIGMVACGFLTTRRRR